MSLDSASVSLGGFHAKRFLLIMRCRMKQLPEISSRDNQRLVQARKIRDGHSTGSIFIEGKRLASEALRSDIEISVCFVSEKFAASGQNTVILERLETAADYIFELPERVFRSVADTENSQGVILIADKPTGTAKVIERRLQEPHSLKIVMMLMRINNPSNLGAVLRTAEAAGISGVLVSANSADAFSPKALRASMGAAFRLPVWTGAGLDEALAWAKSNGLRPTATGSTMGDVYTQADLQTPRLLLFGPEADGLAANEVNRVDESLTIPMENGVESLNLAVAAGIILFEAKRQNDHN